jgi:uncharacterized membrane protein YphA (DoxX/SURF4 family)
MFRCNGAAVLLLRACLGAWSAFAGLRELADPSFFGSMRRSFEDELRRALPTSPLQELLGLCLGAPAVVATMLACCEPAVGAGTLSGRFGRVAASGGMALTIFPFPAVGSDGAWHDDGRGIVVLLAWVALLLGGSGPISVDRLLACLAATARASAASLATCSSLIARRRAGVNAERPCSARSPSARSWWRRRQPVRWPRREGRLLGYSASEVGGRTAFVDTAAHRPSGWMITFVPGSRPCLRD